jgi:hypothetical protein
MEALVLPRLGLANTLDTALVQMHAARRSGIVGEEADKFWLYSIRDVLKGHRAGVPTLAGLDRAETVHRLTTTELAMLSKLALVFPQRHANEFQELFRRYPHHHYAAFGAVDESVVVITDSELRKGPLLFALADRFCTGPKMHSIPPAGVNADGTCNQCGYPVVSL